MSGEDKRSRALQFALQSCAPVLRTDRQVLFCPGVRAEPEGGLPAVPTDAHEK